MPNPMSQTAMRATSVADHGGHVDASREADHCTIFACFLSMTPKGYAQRVVGQLERRWVSSRRPRTSDAIRPTPRMAT
jgi:hypothetical protein